ncbi:MAG TPA: hypothetical protein VKX17_07355 [Planctomycetota bacterium]|nr:hypothetical protein [Planctomycetota bacterium]
MGEDSKVIAAKIPLSLEIILYGLNLHPQIVSRNEVEIIVFIAPQDFELFKKMVRSARRPVRSF